MAQRPAPKRAQESGPNLASMDLNLLVALEALLAEASVTRAAARVGLSQPAMSNALARLRRQFGDPLLVRAARGMALTERAQALREPLAGAITSVREVLSPSRSFTPRESDRIFAIAATDYAEVVLLPALLTRLHRGAPRARFRFETMDLETKRRRFEALTDGLLRRHFADVDVCKILGANFLRVFRGVLGVPSPLPG